MTIQAALFASVVLAASSIPRAIKVSYAKLEMILTATNVTQTGKPLPIVSPETHLCHQTASILTNNLHHQGIERPGVFPSCFRMHHFRSNKKL